jgi:probable rRNA maturation factor
MADEPPDTPRSLQVELLNLQPIAVDEARIIDIARRTATSEGAFGELSVVLVDSGKMAEMNSAYRAECGPTDVLSFSIDGLISGGIDSPDDSPPFVIGEVIICPEVARKQAAEGLMEEIELLVAHGVLHLMGYSHDDLESARDMAGKEFGLLGRFGARAE